MRAWAIVLLALAAAARAEEPALRDGPGRDLVARQCAICHSLDYIPMNSPFLDRSGWERTVRKMIDTMGAPIDETDVPALVDYLARAYGR